MDSDERFEKWLKRYGNVDKVKLEDIVGDPESYNDKRVLLDCVIENVEKITTSGSYIHMLVKGYGDNRDPGNMMTYHSSVTSNSHAILSEPGDEVTIHGEYEFNNDHFYVRSIFNHGLAKKVYGGIKKSKSFVKTGTTLSENIED